MTTMHADLPLDTTASSSPDLGVRLLCAATAVGAIAVVPLMGGISGDTGAEATRHLVDNAGRFQAAAILAVFVAAGLLVAAVRLGSALRVRLGGSSTPTLVTVAGAAVATLYAAYYTSIGAGAVVSSMLLDDPGAGVGESTLVLLNVAELSRYAPGLVLVAAAVAARRVLPKTVWITAAALGVFTVIPMTGWAAAVAIPVWLAGTAAAVGSSASGRRTR